MKFVQHIRVTVDNVDDLLKLSQEAPTDQMSGNPQAWILADRDNPGQYIVSVVFDSLEEALKNNDLQVTQEFAAKMRSIVSGEPGWGNFDLIAEY
jgi:hypothetical protein